MKKRVLSGIQPTGSIHLGNYLGAIQNWVKSQDEYDNFFCVVDLHAITVPQDPKKLRSNIHELACILFAAGLDPQKCSLFVQSDIPEHTELTWILNCHTPMSWMSRMTQFKEKSQNQKDKGSIGLFDYPVLMAADILLYDTNLVPVGEDQTQHLELTRDIAERFNSIYGETFKMPDIMVSKVAARVMGLDDPLKKMSKSEEKQNHAVYLLDPPEKTRKKIMRATTDSSAEIRFDENRPGIFNLLGIYQALSGENRQNIEAKFEGKGYGDFKKSLAELVIDSIEPIRKRYEELAADPAHVEKLLKEGAKKVRPVAQNVIERVKTKVGLGS